MSVKTAHVFGAWCNKPVDLVLKENEITCLEGENELYSAALEDVVGLRVLDRPAPASPERCQAEICTYGVDKSMKKPKRKMKSTLIWFSEGDTYEANHRAALEWRKDIQAQCLKNDCKVFLNDGATSPDPPRLLVIMNPFSGRKKALTHYRNKVHPLFEVAGVEIVEELVTERQNHAKEFIQSFDFSRITGIVTVGGDGTLYEVVNGIMRRPDWESTIKTPFGVIPTGSGNSVLASLLYEQSEEYCIQNAVLQIIRGGVQSIDLATVNTVEETVYMFTALTWGLIGDTDIESERVRFLGGEIRDVIGGLKCIMQKRLYHGKLSYLPSGETTHGEEVVSVKEAVDVEGEQRGLESKQELPDDNKSDPQNSDSLGDGATEHTQSQPSPPPTRSPPPNLFPSLSEAVPSNWVTVEDDFLSVAVLMVPLLTNKFIGHPNIVLGSGEFYIVHINTDAKRKELLQAMLAMETGEYINFPKVHTIRTRACRIEPITTPGRLVVDGEVIDYGPIQAQLGKQMKIFSRKKK